MKINKKGEIKLDKCETRVGNYVVREEKNYIKVSDINDMVSWRYHNVFIGKGLFLKEMMNRLREGAENAEDAIKNIIFVDHYALTAVLDAESLLEVTEVITKGIKKHPEIYGLDPNASDEKNEEDLNSVKDLNAFQEEIEKKLEEDKEKE